MGASDPRTRLPGRAAAVRTLAIPAAVLLAGVLCALSLIALSLVAVPQVRVTVGEEGPAAAPGAPSEEPAPEPSQEREPGAQEETEEDPPVEPAPSPAPEPPVPPPDPSDPGTGSVPPSAYDGATTSVGVFRVDVEVAYTDPTITDGMGTDDTAPSGWEFHIYRLNVTNEGSSPVIFDSSGTMGTTTDGQQFPNDVDAEHTVAYDYFWDEIDPGETVTTHIMFLTPVDTEFAHVLVAGQSDLRPR
jgi:hypothetical protein